MKTQHNFSQLNIKRFQSKNSRMQITFKLLNIWILFYFDEFLRFDSYLEEKTKILILYIFGNLNPKNLYHNSVSRGFQSITINYSFFKIIIEKYKLRSTIYLNVKLIITMMQS